MLSKRPIRRRPVPLPLKGDYLAGVRTLLLDELAGIAYTPSQRLAIKLYQQSAGFDPRIMYPVWTMYGPHIITLCFLNSVIDAGLRPPRTCELCEKDLSYNERHSLMVPKPTGRRCPRVTLCSGGYWHECHRFELGYYGLCSVCQMVTQPRYDRCTLDHDNRSAAPCRVHPVRPPPSTSTQDSPLSLSARETQPPPSIQDA